MIRIVYISASGEQFDLIAGSFVKIKTANFHNWNYTAQATARQYGEKVKYFKKPAVQYNVQLYVQGSKMEREAFLRSFHEAAAHDLFEGVCGKLMWGNWILDCNITGSSTYPHDTRPDTTVNDIMIYGPDSFWYRLDTFTLETETTPAGEGLDFPIGFPFDFTPSKTRVYQVTAEHYMSSDFVMTITGPATNPKVTVNGHPYQVYTTVPEGVTLTIDSKNRKIVLINSSGLEVNIFAARRKDYSVFAKIPAGALTVVKSGDFDLDLALRYERNEPTLWT